MMISKSCFSTTQQTQAAGEYTGTPPMEPIRPSVVQVYFAERDMSLAYYNDRFVLHCGDYVFVDGKLAGLRGVVESVHYNFKIHKAQYKRILAVADTQVQGKIFFNDDYCLTFSPTTFPAEKVISWFRPPLEKEDFFCGYDDSSFLLADLEQVWNGCGWQNNFYPNQVLYLSLSQEQCYALVSEKTLQTVEFRYCNGEISRLVCSCFISGNCAHEYAVLQQLQSILAEVNTNYADLYADNQYVAAVEKDTLLSILFAAKKRGSFTL